MNFIIDMRKLSDELYCNIIYENNKTCKEVGPFRTKQKLMQENEFKQKNIELKEKVEKRKLTQAEYMEWIEKQ